MCLCGGCCLSRGTTSGWPKRPAVWPGSDGGLVRWLNGMPDDIVEACLPLSSDPRSHRPPHLTWFQACPPLSSSPDQGPDQGFWRYATYKSVDRQVAIRSRFFRGRGRSPEDRWRQPSALSGGTRTVSRGLCRRARVAPHVCRGPGARRTESLTTSSRKDCRATKGQAPRSLLRLNTPWP